MTIAVAGSVAFVVLNALLFYLVLPARVGLLAKIVEPDPRKPDPKGTRMLRLALQNLESVDLQGVVTIRVHIDAPGAFDLARDAELNVSGPPEVKTDVSASLDGKDLVIDVERLRALKTITFAVPCQSSTTRAGGSMLSPRRRAGELLPFLGNVEVPRAFREPVRVEWSAELGVAQAQGRWHGAMSSRESWAPFVYESRIVLLVAVLAGLALYVSSAGLMSEPIAPTALDIGLAGGFVLTTSLVFMMLRPSWTPVAQGYLEPTTVPIEGNEKGPSRGQVAVGNLGD